MNNFFSIVYRFEKVIENQHGKSFDVDAGATAVFESVLIGAYAERFGKFCAANPELGDDARRIFCDQICAEILFQRFLDIASEQAARDKIQSLAGYFDKMRLGGSLER